jgi:hypothetical protein
MSLCAFSRIDENRLNALTCLFVGHIKNITALPLPVFAQSQMYSSSAISLPIVSLAFSKASCQA